MKVYLKYHEGTLENYWYLGFLFKATDQLFGLDLSNSSNDFHKNIKIGSNIETFIKIFKTHKPVYKRLGTDLVCKFYDDCLMRVGNLYTKENNRFYSSSGESDALKRIRYTIITGGFNEDPTLYSIETPLKDLDISKYSYDFASWMIHRSIQELN